jgi:peptidyl-prolyl cis-trans isomerase A (cyclophilin A)
LEGREVKYLFSIALLALAGCSGDAATAPAEFKVKFETSKGAFVVEVHREWAPNGADRFYELVKSNFYNEARFFRVVPGFVVQWGIPKDPTVAEKWRKNHIQDDPVAHDNELGAITFASSGANSRTTQVFINLADNARLNPMGFAPFGKVIEGMDVVQSIYSGYGQTPDQNQIQKQGNAYLQGRFPELDYIKSTQIQ